MFVAARPHVAVAVGVSTATKQVDEPVWLAAPRQPLFAFFTGESWQSFGSRRFARDVRRFVCRTPSAAGDGCDEPFQPSLAFADIDLDNVAFVLHLDALSRATHSNEIGSMCRIVRA